MEYFRSRRIFMRKLGLASAGISIFSSTNVMNAFPKKLSPFPGYNPYAEYTTDMRKNAYKAKPITINGVVYDQNTLKCLANIELEVWHLSPGTNKFRHHGKLKTNAQGEYKFITDLPGRDLGRSPRIYFKILGNQNLRYTELIIGEHDAFITGKHWEQNKSLGDLMQPVKTESQILYNLSI